MSTSPDVPGRLPVAIENHAFQIEPAGFKRETVQVLRQQADTSFEPGEESLNPQGLWRRSQESWHHGAGQDFLDGRKGLSAYTLVSQDPERFRTSKGLDPWTRGQLSLLHPTIKTWSTSNTNLYLAVTYAAGNAIFVLYLSDGTKLYWAGLPYSLFNTLGLLQGTGWSAVHANLTAYGGGLFTGINVTATSSAAVSLTSPTGTSGRPVEAGRQYGFVVESDYVGGGGAKTVQINVTWYDASGATISSTSPVSSAGTDGTPAEAVGNAVAPSNAAYVSVTVGWTTNWTSGEIHDVVASVGPYDDTSTIGFPDTWTDSNLQAVSGAQPIQSIATDGSHVWVALGTRGLYRTDAGALTATASVPAAPGGGQISLVGYANGFLLAAGSTSSTTGQNTLWVVNDPLGTPTLSALKTHPNSSFVWTFIAPGRNCVYAGGNSGGNGEVYKITYDPNSGSLSTGVSFSSYLPDGETIHALQFYAGGVVMGTGKGVRIGQADANGDIDYGPLIPTDWPVRCLEPQDRYCWFGWTKYDAMTSGLGRIDLGFQTDTMTPAWASDLMTPDTTQGDVVSAVTFSPYGYTANQRPPVRVFSVAGSGVYIEDPGSRVPSGQILTGACRFSTSEPKVTRSIDVRHHALPAGASVAVDIQRDASGTWESLGSSATTGSYGPTTPIDALSESAEAIEFRFTLARPTPAGTDYSQTPELTRWTAKVLPTPSTIDETFTIPILLRREVVDNNDSHYHVDVAAEAAYLKGLEQSRELVNLQLGPDQYTVYIVASQFQAQNWGPDRTYLEGLYTIICQTVRG